MIPSRVSTRWFLFVVLIAKTVFSLEILSDGSDDYEYGSNSHHRSRRAIEENASCNSGNLMVFATPFLDLSYYFNPLEEITFEIRAAYNGSGPIINNVTIAIASKHLYMIQEKNGQPTQLTSAEINITSLGINDEFTVNLTTKVKTAAQPLDILKLLFSVTALQSSSDLCIKDGTSSPDLYTTFPDIAMNGTKNLTLSVYDEKIVNMAIVIPPFNFSLLVELTTNIEDYVFMEIKDADVSIGSAVTTTISDDISYISSQQNNENDRVVFNFGNVSTPSLSEATEAEKTITIQYTVKVNDHEKLENGSTHYFGAGIQAGSGVLWVEQYPIVIDKQSQPALSYTVTSEQTTNDTKLYIGDAVQFDFNIGHTATSTGDAHDVIITVCSDALTPVTLTNQLGSNDTCVQYKVNDTFPNGESQSTSVSMKLNKNITPLMYILPDIFLTYKNGDGIEKRPIKESVKYLTTGTPIIRLDINGSSDTIKPKVKLDFYLTITLTRMRSPIVIEVIMPIVDGEPVMSLLSMEFVSVGSNIKNLTQSSTAQLKSTTNFTQIKDQGLLDLGVAYNEETDQSDSPDNEIKVKFQAFLSDHTNLTDNTSSYWVGAGFLGKPKMVWVGQVKINTYLPPEPKPLLYIDLDTNGTGDIYEYKVSFGHLEDSVQYPYNITFEYYLPPYVEFVKETTGLDDVENTQGTKYKYTGGTHLGFFETFNHSIRVKLNREKSPYPGKFDFSVMVRVSYDSKHINTRYEFFKAVKREIEVLPDYPIIPRSPRAKKHYYGRGFFWDKVNGSFYVCLNQHVPTMKPACYKHIQDSKYSAMDRRIGCIVGINGANMYGIARNGITPMKYENSEWYPIQDSELPAIASFTKFKDLTGTTSVGVVDIPSGDHLDEHNGDKWQGTGDGLYFKGKDESDWTARAKWFLH